MQEEEHWSPKVNSYSFPRLRLALAEASGIAVSDLEASSLDAALAGSDVYRKRSPQQTLQALFYKL